MKAIDKIEKQIILYCKGHFDKEPWSKDTISDLKLLFSIRSACWLDCGRDEWFIFTWLLDFVKNYHHNKDYAIDRIFENAHPGNCWQVNYNHPDGKPFSDMWGNVKKERLQEYNYTHALIYSATSAVGLTKVKEFPFKLGKPQIKWVAEEIEKILKYRR